MIWFWLNVSVTEQVDQKAEYKKQIQYWNARKTVEIIPGR